jgi:hypothetical protein
MRVIYYGKRKLLSIVKRYTNDVFVAKNLFEFFVEPSAYHLVDGQLFDDIKTRRFTDLMIYTVRNIPEIEVHIAYDISTCRGGGAIGALEANGAVGHMFFLDSKRPLDEQLGLNGTL